MDNVALFFLGGRCFSPPTIRNLSRIVLPRTGLVWHRA